jgi:hypothetical protein
VQACGCARHLPARIVEGLCLRDLGDQRAVIARQLALQHHNVRPLCSGRVLARTAPSRTARMKFVLDSIVAVPMAPWEGSGRRTRRRRSQPAPSARPHAAGRPPYSAQAPTRADRARSRVRLKKLHAEQHREPHRVADLLRCRRLAHAVSFARHRDLRETLLGPLAWDGREGPRTATAMFGPWWSATQCDSHARRPAHAGCG